MIRRLHLVTPSLNTSKKLVILVTLIQLRLDRTADEKQTDDTEFSKSPRPLSSVRGRKSSKKLCSPRFAAQRRAKEQQQQQQQQQWPLSLHPDETSSSSQPVRSTGLLSSRRGQATAERQTWSRSRLPKPFCGQIGVNPNSEGPSAASFKQSTASVGPSDLKADFSTFREAGTYMLTAYRVSVYRESYKQCEGAQVRGPMSHHASRTH